MSFGMDIGGVRRTRSFTGENTAGITKAAEQVETDDSAPVRVDVTAVLADDGYALTIKANGESHTLREVDPADLADELARVINAVAKAYRAGNLERYRQPEPAIRLGSAHTFTRKSKADVFSG